MNNANVKIPKRLSLQPKYETIMITRAPNYVTVDVQGVCVKKKQVFIWQRAVDGNVGGNSTT